LASSAIEAIERPHQQFRQLASMQATSRPLPNDLFRRIVVNFDVSELFGGVTMRAG
jgi:hypothetical protein